MLVSALSPATVPDPLIVCLRVGVPGELLPGSRAIACCKCGADVWISPESDEQAKRDGLAPVCVPCTAIAGGPVRLVPLTRQEALASPARLSDGELRRLLRKVDQADA